jgi:ElaB/YqjD/DUF883 family membrane-anchored ribosome-binding protein
MIPLSRFGQRELAIVDNVSNSVDFTNADSITSQMNGPNQRFADALTSQLAGIKVYQTGAAEGIILDLSRQIKAANLKKMSREARGEDWVAASFGKLPLVGGMASAIRHFQLTHKSLVGELERIRKSAERELNDLRRTHAMLEQQEVATEAVLREMMVHIAGCQRATIRGRAEFEAMRTGSMTGDRDPFKLQKLQDYAENLTMLETRLVNAQVSFVDKMMAIPDIRARQRAARIEISNTIDSIQNDLPDLISAIGRLVSTYNISQSQRGNELRRQNREMLAQANADALNDVYLAAKRSQGGATEQIDQLSGRLDRLLQTLDEGARIDADNARERANSVARLEQLRDKLLEGMADNVAKTINGI